MAEHAHQVVVGRVHGIARDVADGRVFQRLGGRAFGGDAPHVGAGELHQGWSEILDARVDLAGLLPVARPPAVAGNDRAAFGELVTDRRVIAEVQHAFRAVAERGVNLPAQLVLGRIGLGTVGHGVEEVPEGDTRLPGVLAHNAEIGAVVVASVLVRLEHGIVVHAEHIDADLFQKTVHIVVVGGRAQLCCRGVVGKDVDVRQHARTGLTHQIDLRAQRGEVGGGRFIAQRIAPAGRTCRQVFRRRSGHEQDRPEVIFLAEGQLCFQRLSVASR